MSEKTRTGPGLRFYLLVSRLAFPVARLIVHRRLKRGKEDPDRFRERLGMPSVQRTGKRLAWFHAVGVGELLALSGLTRSLGEEFPDLQVLLTSISRTSADAVTANLPAHCCHQYLPLDCFRCIRTFLDHWQPDLAVWVERDIWPATILETDRRGIPLAMINGRMDAASYSAKARIRGVYSDLYRRFQFVGAQDRGSAEHYYALGVDRERIWVSGSLKAGAAPLADQPEYRALLERTLSHRNIWLAASTHAADEATVAEAHRYILQSDPSSLLVVAPRDPGRARNVEAFMQSRGLTCERLKDGVPPSDDCQVAIIDKIGRLGTWYRVSRVGFIGGSMSNGGGHNPYEPARLGCAVVHGPSVRNFEGDYKIFHSHRAARKISDGKELADAVLDPKVRQLARNVEPVLSKGESIVQETVDRLSPFLERTR